MPWPVRDCPLHECCALGFASGTLCLACGTAILDTIDGPACVPPSETLLGEARAAFNDNQGVRDFTASARAKGVTDGPQASEA